MDQLPDWSAPVKPAEATYARLIKAILDGTFPPNSLLPGERKLSTHLGVTRGTLREALQRLDVEGWVEIHQGKPTRVRDIWTEGKLNTLAALVEHHDAMPSAFVPQLLEVRLALAPAYAQAALENNAAQMVTLMDALLEDLDEDPGTFAQRDWHLHHRLSVLSGNPIFTLILNGFEGFYQPLAELYFSFDEGRAASRQFYHDLRTAAHERQPVEDLVREAMQVSLSMWHKAMGG